MRYFGLHAGRYRHRDSAWMVLAMSGLNADNESDRSVS
jgi:hypothetical protein